MVILEEPIKKPKKAKDYINGEFVESKSDQWIDVVNPATQKIIGNVPVTTTEEFDEAVAAAKDAFPKWRRTTPLARVRYLFRLKNILEERFEEMARVSVMEHGKTIDESRGEVRRGIENVEVATGIPSLMMGYNLEDIAHGLDEMVVRQPLGVFGIISPFNFPFMIPCWFFPYALATGNTVVLKASSETPLSMDLCAEILDELDLPPGVINVVHGDRRVVQAMLTHRGIKGISFVGSTKVGRDVIYKTAAEYGKKVQAQCGAKNYMVVMEDAVVPNTAASLMTSVFGNTGQRCLAGANVVVVGENDAFYKKFKEEIITATKNIRTGYGLDESITMGPIRSPDKKQNVIRYIEKGIEEGAKLLIDGRKPTIIGNYPDTCFINPTIFENVTNDMVVAQEEIFGPVMTIMRAKNLDEAVDLIHANPYGNSSAIYTTNGKWARQFVYDVECGNIGINIGIVAPMAFFPFSGMKNSFFGDRHGQGRDVIEFYTERKVVISRWW